MSLTSIIASKHQIVAIVSIQWLDVREWRGNPYRFRQWFHTPRSLHHRKDRLPTLLLIHKGQQTTATDFFHRILNNRTFDTTPRHRTKKMRLVEPLFERRPVEVHYKYLRRGKTTRSYRNHVCAHQHLIVTAHLFLLKIEQRHLRRRRFTVLLDKVHRRQPTPETARQICVLSLVELYSFPWVTNTSGS